DLQISSSSESEYNSDNSLNDSVSVDNLNDNNIIGNSLKNEDIYKDLNDNDILENYLTNCLFIIIFSIGIHNHPPPPPIKTSQNIINNLRKIIESKHNLSFTAYKLLSTFIKMEIDMWNQISNNTNISKSLYANINQDDQSLTLL
ncbi:11838_t:CDS:2, partial [Cetraspora pellucida]